MFGGWVKICGVCGYAFARLPYLTLLKVDSGHQIFTYFIVCILICTKNDGINRRMSGKG